MERLSELIKEVSKTKWLGYGNLNGEIWFIGTEEGGAEIWRKEDVKTNTKTLLQESLEIRKNFKSAMDFVEVWENKYGITLDKFKGPTVWRFMAAFILSWEGKNPSTKEIKKYVFTEKNLGLLNANHFLCELFPLPKKGKNEFHDDYKGLVEWKTIQDYHKELLDFRINLLIGQIQENKKIKILIVYEKMARDGLINKIENKRMEWSYKNLKFELYKLNIGTKRGNVFLLSTPFFGQGQISYNDIKESVKILKDFLKP